MFGSVEILRELHFHLVILRDEVPPEVADSSLYSPSPVSLII